MVLKPLHTSSITPIIPVTLTSITPITPVTLVTLRTLITLITLKNKNPHLFPILPLPELIFVYKQETEKMKKYSDACYKITFYIQMVL